MIVLIVENAPTGVRGELSRWLIEPRAGVFVGRVSALVRDKLWNLVCGKIPEGGAALLYPAFNDQGFAVRTHGERARSLVDYEGLTLVQLPKPTRKGGKTPEE